MNKFENYILYLIVDIFSRTGIRSADRISSSNFWNSTSYESCESIPVILELISVISLENLTLSDNSIIRKSGKIMWGNTKSGVPKTEANLSNETMEFSSSILII